VKNECSSCRDLILGVTSSNLPGDRGNVGTDLWNLIYKLMYYNFCNLKRSFHLYKLPTNNCNKGSNNSHDLILVDYSVI